MHRSLSWTMRHRSIDGQSGIQFYIDNLELILKEGLT